MKSKLKREGVGTKFRVRYFTELPRQAQHVTYSRYLINEWMTGRWTDGRSVLPQRWWTWGQRNLWSSPDPHQHSDAGKITSLNFFLCKMEMILHRVMRRKWENAYFRAQHIGSTEFCDHILYSKDFSEEQGVSRGKMCAGGKPVSFPDFCWTLRLVSESGTSLSWDPWWERGLQDEAQKLWAPISASFAQKPSRVLAPAAGRNGPRLESHRWGCCPCLVGG